MTTQSLSTAAPSLPPRYTSMPVVHRSSNLPMDPPYEMHSYPRAFHWQHLSHTMPVIRMLQPDYYLVFSYSNPGIPVYHQNLSLHFGPLEVKYELIKSYIDQADLRQIQKTDIVINQFARECRLQPFEIICTIMFRWNDPAGHPRYFIRKTSVLECDDRGIPQYGIMTFTDVTPMVSATKPLNVDVVFHPDKASLCYEISKRIQAVQPERTRVTEREREIILCLRKGMSSKEIASALFISKATVDTHRQNLIHKWKVTNTAALLQRAMEEGCL